MAFITPEGANTADSTAVTVTGDVRPADPFTKTGLTFTEAVASTSEDWAGFYVSSAQGQLGILSVWTGVATSEVRIASMPMKSPLLAQDANFMYVPVPVPSGTRLSVTFSGRSTISINELQISGIPSSNFSAEPPFTVMDCGPFDLTNSSVNYGRAPIIDPGGTINTLGSYAELSQTGGNNANNILNGDSLSFQYKFLGFMLSDNEQNQTNQERLWTIAHGAVASEVDFMAEFYDHVSSTETNMMNQMMWIPWDRASGDRLAAKMQCSINDAADRLGQCLVFGLR